jgi:TRAP-type C4-dicarboxylate transport system permease small subunit
MALISWLVLPLIALLFVQWPLRDWVHLYSSQANDAAQILFAWYVVLAISVATRCDAHFGACHTPRLRVGSVAYKLAVAACVLPWVVLMLKADTATVIQSVRQLERFPDSFNPGYFLIKLAGLVLAVLAGYDAFRLLMRKPR